MQLGFVASRKVAAMHLAAALRPAAARRSARSGEHGDSTMLHGESETCATAARATLADLARGLFQDPNVVTWRCGGCGWELWCSFASRRESQQCDDCGHRQRVPPSAFGWNERMATHLGEVAERRRRRRAQAAATAREAASARRAEEARRRASIRLAAASIATSAGLIGSAAEFDSISDEQASRMLELAALARSLASDLRAAAAEAETADDGERAVREGTGWGSIACLALGSFWMAAGLTAASLASREIVRDWKRSRAATYRRRWEDAMSNLNAAEAKTFTVLFSHLHPREAAAIVRGSVAA